MRRVLTLVAVCLLAATAAAQQDSREQQTGLYTAAAQSLPPRTYGGTRAATATAYEDSCIERQMYLIESFTSTSCTYCYIGHDVLTQMQQTHPGKYAWVAMHFPLNTADPYHLSSADDIASFEGVTGYPSAALNRYYLDDSDVNPYHTLAVPIGYNNTTRGATTLNTLLEAAYDTIPALASVDIYPYYAAATRELTITVSGNGTSDAQQLLDGYRLTIYLTEDGISGAQYSKGRWDFNYTHDNVLRAIVNDYPWGDDIHWTSAATYENSVTTTIDEAWDESNIYIVAFLSKAMATKGRMWWTYNDIHEAYVNNCNRVKMTATPAGITTAPATAHGSDTYYSLDGRQLTTPTRGITLVRHADGTIRKVCSSR